MRVTSGAIVPHTPPPLQEKPTDDDVIRVACLGDLLDEQVHHPPQVVILALEQLRHSEKHLGAAQYKRVKTEPRQQAPHLTVTRLFDVSRYTIRRGLSSWLSLVQAVFVTPKKLLGGGGVTRHTVQVEPLHHTPSACYG